MNRSRLLKKYCSHEDRCYVCGSQLASNGRLGDYFVMDKTGNFFCSNCDSIFTDGDERIFDPALEVEQSQGEALAVIMGYLHMAISMGFFDDSEANDIDEAMNVILSNYYEERN